MTMLAFALAVRLMHCIFLGSTVPSQMVRRFMREWGCHLFGRRIPIPAGHLRWRRESARWGRAPGLWVSGLRLRPPPACSTAAEANRTEAVPQDGAGLLEQMSRLGPQERICSLNALSTGLSSGRRALGSVGRDPSRVTTRSSEVGGERPAESPRGLWRLPYFSGG